MSHENPHSPIPRRRPSASRAPSGRTRRVANSRRVTPRQTEEPPTEAPTAEQPPAKSVRPKKQPNGPKQPREAERTSFEVSRRLVAVVATLTILAAAAAGYLLWDLRQIRLSVDARTAGQVTAAEYVEKILAYDHAEFDANVAQAQKLMTGHFAEEYTSTVKKVRQEAIDNEAVVKAEVVASSIVDADPDTVRALLFVNQTTTGKQVAEPRVDLNRVVVTLTSDGDGGWLVAKLDAL